MDGRPGSDPLGTKSAPTYYFLRYAQLYLLYFVKACKRIRCSQEYLWIG
jgi:hypothetical protein